MTYDEATLVWMFDQDFPEELVREAEHIIREVEEERENYYPSDFDDYMREIYSQITEEW